MRKKTTKFYFFNQKLRQSSINTIFSFSKRAVKQRKQLSNIIVKSGRKLNSRLLYRWNKNVALYKSYNTVFKQTQWSIPKYDMKRLFCYSYFIKNFVVRRFRPHNNFVYKRLFMWFRFKNRFNKQLNVKLHRFPKLGLLSSHFVHVVSKKNLTYQNRSKYKAKIYNMNTMYSYLYIYTAFIYNFLNLINNKTYFFTRNISKQSGWINEDFFVENSNWIISRPMRKNTNTEFIMLPFNKYDYTIHDYNSIYVNKDLITQYLNEVDLSKKEILYSRLNLILTSNTLELITVNQQLITESTLIHKFFESNKLSFLSVFYSEF